MGDPIRLGQLNNAGGSNTTVQTSSLGPAYLVKQNGGGTAIRGESAGHAAILETQGPNKYALLARNASDGRGSGAAITAQGGHGVGLEARSYDKHGIIASSIRGVGIHGGGAERGVSGFSDSRDGIGVYGYSVRGNGVVGGTDSRYDGYAGLLAARSPSLASASSPRWRHRVCRPRITPGSSCAITAAARVNSASSSAPVTFRSSPRSPRARRRPRAARKGPALTSGLGAAAKLGHTRL